jgi:hypothetical protein
MSNLLAFETATKRLSGETTSSEVMMELRNRCVERARDGRSIMNSSRTQPEQNESHCMNQYT